MLSSHIAISIYELKERKNSYSSLSAPYIIFKINMNFSFLATREGLFEKNFKDSVTLLKLHLTYYSLLILDNETSLCQGN